MTNDELLAGFDNLLLEVLDNLSEGLPSSLSESHRETIEAHVIRVVQAARDGVDDFGRHIASNDRRRASRLARPLARIRQLIGLAQQRGVRSRHSARA